MAGGFNPASSPSLRSLPEHPFPPAPTPGTTTPASATAIARASGRTRNRARPASCRTKRSRATQCPAPGTRHEATPAAAHQIHQLRCKSVLPAGRGTLQRPALRLGDRGPGSSLAPELQAQSSGLGRHHERPRHGPLFAGRRTGCLGGRVVLLHGARQTGQSPRARFACGAFLSGRPGPFRQHLRGTS